MSKSRGTSVKPGGRPEFRALDSNQRNCLPRLLSSESSRTSSRRSGDKKGSEPEAEGSFRSFREPTPLARESLADFRSRVRIAVNQRAVISSGGGVHRYLQGLREGRNPAALFPSSSWGLPPQSAVLPQFPKRITVPTAPLRPRGPSRLRNDPGSTLPVDEG